MADLSLRSTFLSLHVPGSPLLLPNPWDVGSARILESLGFRALGTTSAGIAGVRGLPDGATTRDQALEHAAAVVASVSIPVSADLENGFGDDPAEVADTVGLAADVGLAGCSIEDWDPLRGEPYPFELSVVRVGAAAERARSAGVVLTARADAHFHGASGPEATADSIHRLVEFARAGADVVYAPRLHDEAALRRVVQETETPVNVLALPGAPDVAALARLGVARVSTGSGLYWAAMGGLTKAAVELRDTGSYGFWERGSAGREVGLRAFDPAG